MSKPRKRNPYKRAYGESIYENWENTGNLETVLDYITECTKKCISQQDICKELKLAPQTFSTMKKKYPRIQEAMDKAKFDLRKDLIGAMYKKAMGYELTEEDQVVQEKDGKQTRKVHRIKKSVGPDYKAITYLLTKNFGVEMSEKYEELVLAQENKTKIEEWASDDTDEEVNDEH